jgi:hypothetical protein
MPFARLIDAVAVNFERWKAQHLAFIIEKFFKDGDCC